MPILDCENPAAIKEFVKCGGCTKVYISRLAIGRFSDLDPEAITVDAEGVITSLGTLSGSFQYVNASLRDVTFTWDYSRESGLYTNTLTIDMKCVSKELRDAVLNAQSICDLVFLFSTSNCEYRVGGLDQINGKFVSAFDSTVTSHSGSIGGDSDISNLVTFTWESFTEPYFTTVEEDNWGIA